LICANHVFAHGRISAGVADELLQGGEPELGVHPNLALHGGDFMAQHISLQQKLMATFLQVLLMNCCEAASQSPKCIQNLARQWGGTLLPALAANLAPAARVPETGFNCINLLTKLAPHLLALERSANLTLGGVTPF